LAARRATPDDLVVLEALSQEQSSIPPEDSQRLFDFDHRFHQAIAQAAHNKYLARTLDHLFGLSQRLWCLALPHIEFLPGAVEKHLDLVGAIKAGNADQAEQIMSSHVQDFYDKVREVLAAEEQTGSLPHHPG
jgi:DNA-binding GntR family transcriptional regulator